MDSNKTVKAWILRLLLVLALMCLPGGVPARMSVQAAQNAFVKLTGGEWVSKDDIHFRYRKKNGKFAKKTWAKIDGRWYFFNKKGFVLRGLRKIDGEYFLFRKNGGAGKTGRMLTGRQSVDGKICYFRTSGKPGVKGARLSSEWQSIDGKTYYFNENGEINTSVVSNQKFIRVIGKLAREDMKRSGILASVTIAQAILESNFGRSLLGLEANNLFGMKAMCSGNTWKSDWEGETYTKKTLEYLRGRYVTVSAQFRAYDSYEESIRDHSNYLRYAMNGSSPRYKGVYKNKSYVNTITIIRNGGYATDPAYIGKICSIIRQYNLTKYDK